MPLKSVLTKAEYDALPEVLRSEYSGSGDKFELAVEGMVLEETLTATNAKLSEFRDTNIKLAKAAKAFEGVDVEEYRRLKTEKKPDTSGTELELAIAKAVEKATSPLNTKVDALSKERDDARSALATKTLHDDMWTVGVKAGVREEARDYWLGEAGKVFRRTDDGSIVGFKGDNQIFSKRKGSAGDPLSVEEWALEMAPLDPKLRILYKDSGGSGSDPKAPKTTTGANGTRVISNDPALVSANLEGLASGKVTVFAGA